MDDCSKAVCEGKSPSEPCLTAAARHVAHDLELLDLAWVERQTRLGWTLWFILARSLDDFFFRFERQGKKDDILAIDVPATADWQPFAEQVLATANEVPDYKAVRTAANKNSAHLTYARTDPNTGHVQPSDAFHRFITGVAAQWLARLKPEVRVWFGRQS